MAGKPIRHEILLTDGAAQDLESIHDSIAEFDSVANADHVPDRQMKIVQSLAQFPERGSYRRNCWRWASRTTGRHGSSRTG